MKLDQIQVGGRYTAKVSGIITTVRVLGIREVPPAWHGDGRGRWRTRIDVINERTGRKTTFASAARLRRPVAGTFPEKAAASDYSPEIPAQPALPDCRKPEGEA